MAKISRAEICIAQVAVQAQGFVSQRVSGAARPAATGKAIAQRSR